METLQSCQSLWQSSKVPFLPPLSSHQTCDVCVIGSGASGLMVAYDLLKAGKSVVVLERDKIGAGETPLSSAHLSCVLGHRYFELQRWHGKEGAKQLVQSHAAAIDHIESVCRDENFDCDFHRCKGYLFEGAERPGGELKKDFLAARDCGLDETELLERAPSSFQTGLCLEVPHQASLNPKKFLSGLLQAVLNLGGQVYPNSAAEEIEESQVLRVRSARGFHVVCQDVVIATNAPFSAPSSLQSKLASYRTYVVGFHIPRQPENAALYWDTNEPYHYIRFANLTGDEGSILLVGGEDHRTGQDDPSEDHFGNLRKWAHEKLGVEHPAAISWSGQVLETPDGAAFIGKNPKYDKHVYVVTGDCGLGLTHAAVAGRILKDSILEKENSLAKVYDPKRLHFSSLRYYLDENVASAAAYTDWATPGDVGSLTEIPKGEGAVLRDGADKIAAFKDGQGHVHMYSAVCPHKKGIVRWNSHEKSWDCPCHGSRFDAYGKVLNGPAPCGLKEIVSEGLENRKQVSA